MLCCFSHVQLFVTLWSVAHQAPLSKEFSRQQYGSGLPCPSSEDLPDPEIKPTFLVSPEMAGRFFTTSTSWSTRDYWIHKKIPHIQEQRRSPRKMVGGAKSHLESNSIPTRDAWRAQINLVCTRTQRHHRD